MVKAQLLFLQYFVHHVGDAPLTVLPPMENARIERRHREYLYLVRAQDLVSDQRCARGFIAARIRRGRHFTCTDER